MVDLFTQRGLIQIDRTHGVRVTLPLAPALILFGPNDSGKTNTLRLITSLFRGRKTPSRDPFRRRHIGDASLEGWVCLPFDLDSPDHRELLLMLAPGYPVFKKTPQGNLVAESDEATFQAAEESKESEFEFVVQGLRQGLLELLDASESGGSEIESVVDALMRDRGLLWLTGDFSSLDFENPSSPTSSDLDRPELEETDSRIGVVFEPILSKLADVVSSDDFEQELGESRFPERILKAITGWERGESINRWEGDEWARMHEDELEESRADPWFDEGTGLPSKELVEGCQRLSILATDLAPPFVTRDYRIDVQVLEPRWWDLNENRRLRIALVPLSDDRPDSPGDSGAERGWPDARFDEVLQAVIREELHEPDTTPSGYGLESVGAGLRVWAMFAVYEALRRFAENEGKSTLFVFDEPERHLHPAAQREAAAFIAAIVRDGANVIVATHAPAFLNEQIPNARYVRLSRGEAHPPFHGYTKAFPLGAGSLAAIESNLSELGLTQAELFQLTRGVLLVEGEHDRTVVEGFFEIELADAHVRILSLRGTENALALLDAELLQQLGVPIFLMLDGTSSRFVDDLNRGRITPGGTKEERALASLAVALKTKAFTVTSVPLNVPDIVWTLPERAVKSLAPRFPGWKQATADLRAHVGPINPKTLLRERYDLAITTSFLKRAIAVSHEHELGPSAVLKGVIASIDSELARARP
jgi:energy-coupling factor transporter ATP-binding protein EcfA2